MQPEYLARLSKPVQQFIHKVEEGAGIGIEVLLSTKQNGGGTAGQGKLAVIIDARRVQLFAPTNGYFPDGAVRHEVLHVQRFHIDRVPKLALADEESWDEGFSDALGALDNAIEHIVIVPVELQIHPERRQHWEAVMRDVCSGLSDIPEGDRRLAVCLHWAFLRNALPDSPQIEITRNFLNTHALLGMADHFVNQFLAAAPSKEEMMRILAFTFPEFPWNRVALEYINSTTGTYQTPIP